MPGAASQLSRSVEMYPDPKLLVNAPVDYSGAAHGNKGAGSRLGEGAVQKQMAPNQHVSNQVVRDCSEHFDSVPEAVLLPEVFEIRSFRTVPSNDKVNIGVRSADVRDQPCQQVQSL